MKRAAARILELLYDREGAFVAMGELAQSFSASPKSLSAALEEIAQAGQKLERSPAQGVRLVRPIRLDAGLIERGLGTSRVGRSVICFPEVDSTNDVVYEASRQRQADGLVVLAEFQRSGRGRQGHQWISPPGANVLMSVLLVDDSLGHEAVTISAGLAVAEGVEAACGVPCSLKWPNDVLVEGRKLSGVLVEIRKRAARRCLVIGIGINVNVSPPTGRVDQPAADLAAQTGAPVERTEVIRHVLRRFDYWVGQIGRGRLEALRQGWISRCGILNQRLAVLSAGHQYVGTVLDVNPLEGLVLRCDEGMTVHLPADASSILP
jgi:BirA family transcriptional regulator, biotin operon repressor / biotin---[acetyl-CoA-carboxylase] ligase